MVLKHKDLYYGRTLYLELNRGTYAIKIVDSIPMKHMLMGVKVDEFTENKEEYLYYGDSSDYSLEEMIEELNHHYDMLKIDNVIK